ncbi:MAG: anti-sigma factor [Planctomycetaceae bacterium]|nr:anti-sigma factor [Planctomycetaceae bacterium]
MSLPPDHFDQGGDPVERLLARAADAALFGDVATLDDERDAAALGIDLEYETEQFELAAAALDLADLERTADDPMPAALASRLHALADALHAPAPPAIPLRADRPARPLSEKVAWIAAAASITVAVASSWPVLLDALRAAPTTSDFLATHPNSLRASWSATNDGHIVGAVAGEVRFDPATGDGELHIEGLAQNDPAREQYQLWIFDAGRDERFPVDGGVFDITCSGRAVIAIRSKLAVQRPTMFAVTVERPGGAVVSERRIALVAKP